MWERVENEIEYLYLRVFAYKKKRSFDLNPKRRAFWYSSYSLYDLHDYFARFEYSERNVVKYAYVSIIIPLRETNFAEGNNLNCRWNICRDENV